MSKKSVALFTVATSFSIIVLLIIVLLLFRITLVSLYTRLHGLNTVSLFTEFAVLPLLFICG